MSRKKRKTLPGQVQASARAAIFFSGGVRGSGKSWGRWCWQALGHHVGWEPFGRRASQHEGEGPSFEECVEQIRACGFGAYTFEGKTYRIRSRYVAGDRPPPNV